MPRTRFWYISSARNGVIGASSFASVTRHSYSVAYAASLSLSLSDFQKRRRLRRTYQFERSSTNASIRRVTDSTSKSCRRSVSSPISWCSSESTQRSSSLYARSPSACAGVQPSRLA